MQNKAGEHNVARAHCEYKNGDKQTAKKNKER